MATLIEAPLVDETLQALPGWTGDQSGISRDVLLPPHLDEELRRQVDVDATAMGHFPEVERLPEGTRFALRTAEVGGVSELDIAMASHISDLAHRLTDEAPDVPVLAGVEAVRDDDVEVEVDSGATPDQAPPDRVSGVRF